MTLLRGNDSLCSFYRIRSTVIGGSGDTAKICLKFLIQFLACNSNVKLSFLLQTISWNSTYDFQSTTSQHVLPV
jgi:hypothetical protein